jgi:UDP-2,3-diacylglucosamine pyrophosphatase LpxH
MRNMTVVISDLHFEEETADIISDPTGALPPLSFRRNVPAGAFEDMMRDVADQARTNHASRIDFVLAGDIIDFYRTQYWFRDDTGLRPYVDCKAVTPALEAKLLSILDAVAAESEVARSIAVFRRFAGGHYLEHSGDGGSATPFGIPTELHYLPGNHDRLANATPAIRRHVRALFGLAGGDAPFPHYILSSDPPLLIRHGHEYDRFNFGADLKGQQIAPELPAEFYDAPTWGDFNTVMVAARLPFLFRRHYGDAAILRDPVLEAIYIRLLEFDDVRPQSALIDFFLNTTVPEKFVDQFAHREVLQKLMWTRIKPVVRELLDEVVGDKFSRQWIWKFFPIPTLFALLRPWRLSLPLRLMRILGRLMVHAGHGNGPEAFAAHETAVHEGTACFVCAGHTHNPQVAHIFTRNDLKRYYTDTGTWRNAVLSAGDKRSYGRINATTYVTFYGKDDDPAYDTEKNPAAPPRPDHGFEFWTGYDQDWPVDNYDR